MRKVELMPTRDCEAGYGPASCVAVITKYLIESCGANNYQEKNIFEIQNFGVCVPKIWLNFVNLHRAKRS